MISKRRLVSLILLPFVTAAMMGAASACPEQEGKTPTEAQPAPVPSEDPPPVNKPRPARSDDRTYKFRIQVIQTNVHATPGMNDIYFYSYAFGSRGEDEIEFDQGEMYKEDRVSAGTAIWLHVTKPRGGGVIQCAISYVPDSGKIKSVIRSYRHFAGPGECDVAWVVRQDEHTYRIE